MPDEAPNRATHGVPTAAARCNGPVSEPTNILAWRSRAANSSSEVDGARIAAPLDRSTIDLAQDSSCWPPQVTTLRNPRAAKWLATSAYRSTGQRFESQPAPGLMATKP